MAHYSPKQTNLKKITVSLKRQTSQDNDFSTSLCMGICKPGLFEIIPLIFLKLSLYIGMYQELIYSVALVSVV